MPENYTGFQNGKNEVYLTLHENVDGTNTIEHDTFIYNLNFIFNCKNMHKYNGIKVAWHYKHFVSFSLKILQLKNHSLKST